MREQLNAGVYDMFGREVLSTSLNKHINRIDISSLSSGQYYVKFTMAGRNVKVSKITKL